MFTILTFGAGFVCAAAIAAWKPNTFRRVVTGVVAAYTWAHTKLIGDIEADKKQD